MVHSPEDITDIEKALKDYPTLRFMEDSDGHIIEGTWNVVFNDEVFESYEIRIQFDDEYPDSLPKVYETSEKIKHEPDMHFNPPSWEACLFVSHQRWEVWPIGAPFKEFLDVPVYNFFLGQTHYAALGYWPGRRERSHGNQGIVEYYQEKFDCTDPAIIHTLLKETFEPTMPRQRKCPCGNRQRLKNCHGKVVKTLRDNQDVVFLKEALLIFEQMK